MSHTPEKQNRNSCGNRQGVCLPPMPQRIRRNTRWTLFLAEFGSKTIAAPEEIPNVSTISLPEPLPRPAVQRTGDELAEEEAACLPQTEAAEEPSGEVLSDREEPRIPKRRRAEAIGRPGGSVWTGRGKIPRRRTTQSRKT